MERSNRPVRGLLHLVAFLFLITTPPPAIGDGGLVPPYGSDIWESSQTALILYDQESETEDLFLSVEFLGEAKDFGWIVPVPALPDLEAAAIELFYDCARLTQPVYRDRGAGWGCASEEGKNRVQAPGQDGDVDIYAEETVGVYQTLTLGADNASVLADSLGSWGYLHDANRIEVEEALQFYIDQSWYFVAMRIDSASVVDRTYDGYWYGLLDPLRLRFAATEPIYPLRISAISAQDPSQVLLYVCTSRRVTFPGARTEYANALDLRELENVRTRYQTLGPLLTGPCFLTKLRKKFTREEMAGDLILEPAGTNEEYRQIHYSGFPSGDLLLLAAIGITFTTLAARKRRESSLSGRASPGGCLPGGGSADQAQSGRTDTRDVLP